MKQTPPGRQHAERLGNEVAGGVDPGHVLEHLVRVDHVTAGVIGDDRRRPR